jgi:hypothetical protein
MSETELAELRAAIEGRHGSVYAFCLRSKLSKGIVYPLLKGRYVGDQEAQARRIKEALGLVPTREERVLAAIRGVACGRCTRRQPCHQCNVMFEAQARAVMSAIYSVEYCNT